MIFHMLCLLMVMMMINSVISAPGQMDARKDMTQARKDKPKPQSSGTLDSIGGGHLLRADSTDTLGHNFRSLEMLISYQDDVPQNMVLIAREDKQKSSASDNLDPIGGGNLVRNADPDVKTNVFRSLESFLENQDNIFKNIDTNRTRQEKQKPSSSGTLDPIGGGNLVKIVDPDTETNIFRSLESFLENQDNLFENMDANIAREEKQKPASSGTLDSIGGGNLVKIVDPDTETNIFRSLESFLENQDSILQNKASVARDEKEKPASSGVLDPLGGGNFVRNVNPDVEKEVFRSLIDNQGRQNMMRLAREDKSTQRSSHALDGLGSGHPTGLVDPYRGQIFRSLDRSHLVDSLDQGGEVLRMLDSISGTDLLSSLDSPEGMAVLSALRKTHTKYPKRMLDSVSGWAFGESKRNFDEIDNVGFNGFAKRSPRYRQLALAKKNFDEIDRAGFETYNKRDFDEIDRAGFETFEKRDRKE